MSLGMVDQALAYVDRNKSERLDRFFDFLRMKSISTDPEFSDDCVATASALSDELSALGFQSRVVSTTGHPVVLAHFNVQEGRPHVVFYGHYDVQPADPLELWDGDPFEPVLLERGDGSKFIRARGASDDKGQVRTFIEACRAWLDVNGALPCGVSIFLEGEEESGSPSMKGFLEECGEELRRADMALICDTPMWDRSTPAITVSLRGMAAGEVVLKGASRDLHSGIYGGAAVNPLHVLSSILANLWDAEGKIMLPGFYDDVIEPGAELTKMWETIGFDDDEFLGAVGLTHQAGEVGYSVLEKTWARPSLEINGLWGGYTGAGFKTVIPSEANAKISFRLAPGQDPDAVWKSLEHFISARLPSGVAAEFVYRGGDPAHAVSIDHPSLKRAIGALKAEWKKDPILMGCGGSIPIVGQIKRELELDTIMAGFALDDDAIHSPNEKYELSSFEKGTRSWIRILHALSE